MKHGVLEEDYELKDCVCGGVPKVYWRYVKGTANRVHYFSKCPACNLRTRCRKLICGAVEDWNNGVLEASQ